MTDALAVNDQVPRYSPRRAHHHNGSVSVGLSHAHVCREKKPAKVAKPAVAPIAQPSIAISRAPVIGRVISNYADVLDIFRSRADQLELSRLELDHIADLPDGYSSVLISKSPRKVFGPVSLGRILNALGLRLVVIEDANMTARTLQRRRRRMTTHAHYGPQFPPISGPVKGWLFGYPAPIAGKPKR
jgi:hypothetical protein